MKNDYCCSVEVIFAPVISPGDSSLEVSAVLNILFVRLCVCFDCSTPSPIPVEEEEAEEEGEEEGTNRHTKRKKEIQERKKSAL